MLDVKYDDFFSNYTQTINKSLTQIKTLLADNFKLTKNDTTNNNIIVNKKVNNTNLEINVDIIKENKSKKDNNYDNNNNEKEDIVVKNKKSKKSKKEWLYTYLKTYLKKKIINLIN